MKGQNIQNEINLMCKTDKKTRNYIYCCCKSKPEVSKGSRPNQDRDKNFRFLPTMHLDFLPQCLAYPLSIYLLCLCYVLITSCCWCSFDGNSFRSVKFVEVSQIPFFLCVFVMNFSFMLSCHKAF